MSKTPTPDQVRAKRIIDCVYIFQKGCSLAGPMAYAHELGPVDPTECRDDLEAFLKEIAKAMEGWVDPDPEEPEIPR